MYSCEITKQNTWPVQTAGRLRQWQDGAYTHKTGLPDCHRRPSVSGRTESPQQHRPRPRGHQDTRSHAAAAEFSGLVSAAVRQDRDPGSPCGSRTDPVKRK